jgi:hypothetical protein
MNLINKQDFLQRLLMQHVGTKCKYCGKVFTLEDLPNTVGAGPHEHGTLACRTCWYQNNEVTQNE